MGAMATASKISMVSALAIAAALGLAGCSAGVNGAAGGASSVDVLPAPGQSVPEIATDAAGASGIKIADADRSIIVTGWATILVDDPEAAADTAVGIVEAAGGRIDSRNVQAPTDYSGGSATLTLRVPADDLDAVLTELQGPGRVQSVSTNASDVTIAVQDLEARIGALRTSIDRLEDLQAQADTVDALIALETAISDRQAQLESLEAEQRYYDDQISMSTMTVDFVSAPVQAEPEPGSFWDGVLAGWHALGVFFGGVIVALGVILPWLIPVVVIGAIIWIIVAGVRRRRRRRDASATPPTAAP